jgi:dihydrofolate reductase
MRTAPSISPLKEDLVSKLRYSGSISLDGFAAGPDQSPEHPLGVGGQALHTWMRQREHVSSRLLEEEELGIGALLMGRNMFGGGPGPWGPEPWAGWWGPKPPFHLPVFVLTHHPRPPLECEGGTTFTFVTEGLDAALAHARQAAGGQHVDICGGATVAKQYLAAGLLDEMLLHLTPVFLGAGVRLFDDETLAKITLEQAFVVEAPGVTHVKYRVLR